MKRYKSYWLAPLVWVFLLSAQAQQADIHSDVLYVKLLMNEKQLDESKPIFQLDQSKIIKEYTPLKRASSNSRTTKSILDGLYKVKVEEGTDIRRFCEEIGRYANVVYAEPIFKEQLLYVPNDPGVSEGNQGYLSVIRAFEAWDISRSSNDIVIGISDTGFDRDHEDIAAKVFTNHNDPPNGIDDDNNGYIDDYHGYDFADNDTIAEAEGSFHGNRVGGLAGADTDNGVGIAGVGFHSMISPLKVFRTANNSSASTYESIIYAADNGYDIINLSWGSPNSYNQSSQDIINYAVEEKDMIVIGAAGNTPERDPFYPANYDNVLSVAATNTDDSKASFSTYNFGVDISAPGNNIYSTFNNNNTYASDNGTSYSSPMVAGAAALVRHTYPDLTARQVMERLRVSSAPIDEVSGNGNFQEMLGYGRLDVYNALINDTLKSIRFSPVTVSNGITDKVYYGDTVNIVSTITNYLNRTAGLLSFSTSSDFAEIVTPTLQLSAMGTLSQKELEHPIIRLSEDTPPETEIEVRIGIQDGGYHDYHYFTFATETDQAEIDNNQLRYTTSGNGNMGYRTDGFRNGHGLQWKNFILASRMGFMIGKSTSQVSDNFYTRINSTSRSMDFNTETYAKLQRHSEMSLQATSTFHDNFANNSLNIATTQKILTNENADYLIHEYRLANNSGQTISQLNAAMFVDWSLANAAQNRSYFDPTEGMLIAFSHDNSIYVGIKSYYDIHSAHQSIDLNDYDNNSADLSENLSDNIKYELSRQTLYDSAGWSGSGNDIATFITHDSITLATGASKKVAFIMAFGDSRASMLASMDLATAAYDRYLLNPSLLEKFVSCEGAALRIDPSEGSQFRFYSDPYAQNLLATGSSFQTGQITQDTSFYVVNIDGSYEGEVQRIDVSLVPRVADFSMSSDTLFLDNATNAIQFTDLSFQPLSWQWDFDNGIQATVQNPTVSYSSTGTYTITLTVENELGCSESFSKTLLVAERPPVPNITDRMVCIDQSITLEADNADSLAIYASLTASQPIRLDTIIVLNNLQKDTTLFISNVTGPFESHRKQIEVSVVQFVAAFDVVADTVGEETAALIINTAQNPQTTAWFVNGTSDADTDTLRLTVSEPEYRIGLKSTNNFGCTDSISQIVRFSQSLPPSIHTQEVCHGDSFTLRPGNGERFGFYANESLTSFIKKGTQMTIPNVTTDTTIYVVGLDSIIPSEPVTANITTKRLIVTITASPDTLYLSEQKTARFHTADSTITSWNWFLNGDFIETVSSPKLFFDTTGVYSIGLSASDIIGCVDSDSLEYVVLDSPPEVKPLSSVPIRPKFYPNPSNGFLFIDIQEVIMLEIFSLSGNLIEKVNVTNRSMINLNLKSGLYLIRLTNKKGDLFWDHLILQ